MMDLILPRKQGKNRVEVASRRESKTHVESYNHGPSFAHKAGGGWSGSRFAWKVENPHAIVDLASLRKQGEGGVEIASRGESKTHVESYNHEPSFAPKAEGRWSKSSFAWRVENPRGTIQLWT